MGKRIAAIVFIFACTALAWVILGCTIFSRTYDRSGKLGSKVAFTWGARQEQMPPTAVYGEQILKTKLTEENGHTIPKQVQETVTVNLPLESSRVDVDLNLEHRMKGLLWYSTYKVGFGGRYVFRNDSDKARDVTFSLRYPAAQAIYDDVQAMVNGEPVVSSGGNDSISAKATVPAGDTATFTVAYRSQALEKWAYKFGDGISQVRDFTLNMRTNFREIDFPDNTLSPTEKRQSDAGWNLTWKYSNLLSGFAIGMTMPEKLQPGPLAGEISFFAPVSLFFFFFIILIIATLRQIDLHPMNYFFLATAFFSFHLLMAYLVDHMSIHAAFVICSAVSVFLVVSYLRLVVGLRFAAFEAGISQFIYLVLFSYAFFFRRFTGLTITIGSILTLFVVMQMTGRIKWAERFAKKVVAERTNGTRIARDPASDWLG